jgi:hypothetical protein
MKACCCSLPYEECCGRNRAIGGWTVRDWQERAQRDRLLSPDGQREFRDVVLVPHVFPRAIPQLRREVIE